MLKEICFILLSMIMMYKTDGQRLSAHTKQVEAAFPFEISEYKLNSTKLSMSNFQLPEAKSISNSLVKELSFDNGIKYYILVFQNNFGNKFVCVDLNRNKSFKDDSIYNSSSMALKDLTFDGLKKLPTFKLSDDKGYTRFLKLCTSNTGISYKTALESTLYLTAYRYDYFSTYVLDGDVSYKILFANTSLLSYFSNSKGEILVVSSNKNALPVTSTNIPAEVNQDIFINDIIVNIDSIFPDASRFYYTITNNNSGKLFGITQGKYLIKQKFIDIEGDAKYLSSGAKEFALLEFWGTWCLPCMKLSPVLDKLYQKYNNRVQFVGVAYDDDIHAVKEYNFIHRKCWDNFYQKEKSDSIINHLKITNYPTFILLDRNDRILFREQGKEGLGKISEFLKVSKGK